MPLFNNLMRPNATVTIQKRTTARDASGGNAETWANVETGVDVLVSGVSGNRDGRFDTKNNSLKFTVTGASSNLAIQNIRLLFTSGLLNGEYASVDSLDRHFGPMDTLLDSPWYSTRCSLYESG